VIVFIFDFIELFFGLINLISGIGELINLIDFFNFIKNLRQRKDFIFLISNEKEGRKFRISSVYINGKDYRIVKAEGFKNNKFIKIKKVIEKNDSNSYLEEFKLKLVNYYNVHFNLYEYKKLNYKGLKEVLKNIGWFKKPRHNI